MEIRQARVDEVAKVFYEEYHRAGYARNWAYVINKAPWRRAASAVLDAIDKGVA